MANKSQHEEFFGALRERGVRKKVAKKIAGLEGNSRRAGAKGEAVAEKAVEDLTAAANDIRRRVLRTDPRRSHGARKAAQARARKTAKRSTAAKKGARTRASVRAHTSSGSHRPAMTVTQLAEAAQREQREHSQGQPRPIGGYGVLVAVYVAMTGGLALLVGRRRRPRHTPSPIRVAWQDLALVSVATHCLSRPRHQGLGDVGGTGSVHTVRGVGR